VSRTAQGLALSILLLVCLIAAAPARLLLYVLPANEVVMQGFGGTLWRGQANRVLVAAGSGYIQLGRVQWSINPFSVFTLSPSGRLNSKWGKQQLSTDLKVTGSQSVEFEHFDGLFSMQLIRAFLPLSVGGDIAVQLERLTLEEGSPTQVAGSVVWRDAIWESARGIVPLGSYALELEQALESDLNGEVITITGAVAASGKVALAGENYSIDISIKADPDLNEQLSEALSLIAQAVAGGYRIKFDGKLSNP
jgi:general secretion pathway protein N